MIDLNRIRSLKTLTNIKKLLTEFISNPIIPQIYKEDCDWSEEDYTSDKEQATELLEKVNHRMESLGKFLEKQAKAKKVKETKEAE
jgi:hypothetical protein